MKPKAQQIEKPFITIFPNKDATLFELVKAAHDLGLELHIVITEKPNAVKETIKHVAVRRKSQSSK